MLSSVSGYSLPSTISVNASAYRYVSSTSSYLPCLLNTKIRLFMLVSVDGCSLPSIFSTFPKQLHLIRLGSPFYSEQEAFHPIDHSESIHRKLVRRFMYRRKHIKASHHMRHQPKLMAEVDLLLGGGICYKLEGEAAMLPLPVRLQLILAPCRYELVHRAIAPGPGGV